MSAVSRPGMAGETPRDAPLRAVVTGATRGIGQAIASRLSAEGWEVYNFDRLAPPDSNSRPDRWVGVDLSSPDAITAAMSAVLDEGPVTGLVNNAGLALPGLAEDATVEDFDLSVAVNMRAPLLCTQALIPAMREQGFGRIVSISSRAHLGKTHRSAYAGTKGGVLSMAKVWALELAEAGITSNVIAPGPIRTELFDAANPPDMPRTRAIIDSVPVKRIGLPEDIANATAFFMDPRSSFVTGQVLYVCGGVTLARAGS